MLLFSGGGDSGVSCNVPPSDVPPFSVFAGGADDCPPFSSAGGSPFSSPFAPFASGAAAPSAGFTGGSSSFGMYLLIASTNACATASF